MFWKITLPFTLIFSTEDVCTINLTVPLFFNICIRGLKLSTKVDKSRTIPYVPGVAPPPPPSGLAADIVLEIHLSKPTSHAVSNTNTGKRKLFEVLWYSCSKQMVHSRFPFAALFYGKSWHMDHGYITMNNESDKAISRTLTGSGSRPRRFIKEHTAKFNTKSVSNQGFSNFSLTLIIHCKSKCIKHLWNIDIYTNSPLKASFIWPLCEKRYLKILYKPRCLGCISKQNKRSAVKNIWSTSLKSIFLAESFSFFYNKRNWVFFWILFMNYRSRGYPLNRMTARFSLCS